MSDGRLRGRVKGLFAGTSADSDLPDPTPMLADPEAERQALQVLVLARRTADEHVASAQQQADKIRSDARTRAEQFAKDAQAIAEGARREAEQVLAEARARASDMAREAQANTDDARRETDRILADGRSKAAEIARQALANAEELDREAQQRYQEVVGSLEAKRTSLQQKIGVLQKFERDYRAKLRKFMQNQLNTLGMNDQPSMDEIEQFGSDGSDAALVK